VRRLSIAVVQGGPSSEAEVSRASAASVARALASLGHRVVRLELDGFLAESLRSGGFELVFPVAHGAVGEDGSLQGLLEILEIPYVGSDVLASALAMSKRMAKVLFARAGLPVAPSLEALRPPGPPAAAGSASRVFAERSLAEVGERLVVKPSSSGSAIGVARLDGREPVTVARVAEAIEAAWTLDDVALVERFEPGKEVTCGVLDAGEPGEPPRALPPTEIRAPNDAFYTYEARYAPGRSQHFCPPPFEPALIARIQAIAVAAHQALGCRDLCRADFVVDDEAGAEGDGVDGARGRVTLLEVNTMPGFTDTSLYPEAAGIAGLSMPELCGRLAAAAHRRGARRRNAALPLPR